MKNKKIIMISAIIVVVVILLLVGVTVLTEQKTEENTNTQLSNNSENLENASNEQGSNSSEETENLDDLELTGEEYSPSVIYDENNSEVKLSDFSDKPMALLFFNTTELATTEVIEILQKNYENYKNQVNFVNISVIDGVTETKEEVKSFIESKSITIPVLYDIDYSAKNEYKIDTIPTLVFINKNGEIINTISEDINEDVIQANLDIISENY